MSEWATGGGTIRLGIPCHPLSVTRQMTGTKVRHEGAHGLGQPQPSRTDFHWGDHCNVQPTKFPLTISIQLEIL